MNIVERPTIYQRGERDGDLSDQRAYCGSPAASLQCEAGSESPAPLKSRDTPWATNLPPWRSGFRVSPNAISGMGRLRAIGEQRWWRAASGERLARALISELTVRSSMLCNLRTEWWRSKAVLNKAGIY